MKPKTKAALVRYLEANPYLRFHHPGGVMPGQEPKIEGRKFVRELGGRLVFETPDGLGSELPMKAGDLDFFEDRFEVKFGSKRLIYCYLETPLAGTEVPALRPFDEAAARKQIADMTPEERILFAALLNSMMK